jgi:pimeloyl-ACP methyl ester carboxylesterase
MSPNLARLIFIHGLMGSSQGVKATLLQRLFPGMLIPDFVGSLDERMAQLETLLSGKKDWQIIGSSLGGLMAALFATSHPELVAKLILLAPALIWPDFAQNPPDPVSIPTVIYHGTQDDLIPLAQLKLLAEKVFLNLTFHVVDDDHGLFKTAHKIDWKEALT